MFQTTDELLGKRGAPSLPTNVSEERLPGLFLTAFENKVNDIRNCLDGLTPIALRQVGRTDIPILDFPPLSKFEEIDEKTVKDIILESPSKSCELDSIPTNLMKSCINELLPAITSIINTSLSTGHVPTIFKRAIIKPLLKKHNLDQNDLKNYRPVSNLPFLSKILEKVVLKQLLQHFDLNKLRETFQSAYRALHSTETALVRVFNDIIMSLDSGNVCLLSLLDLSAAFDTIDHNILLNRLKTNFNITGNSLLWFESYLKAQTQCVKVGNAYSDEVVLPFGVPQGSVLGPILFTVYMQPAANIIRNYNLQYHQYADDTQIYKALNIKHLNLLTKTTEDCVSDLKSWMTQNKLQLNESKTEIVLFGKPTDLKKTDNQVLEINSSNVVPSRKAKNLGIIFDQTLSMNDHVSSVCKTLYFEISRISLIRRYLSFDVTVTLMVSLVLSKLDYGNALLSGLSLDQLNKLQKVQNHAAKIIYKKKKNEHVKPLLKSLHWLPVKERIDYKIATIVFKCLNNLAPQYLQELLHLNLSKTSRCLRSTSDKTLLFIPKTNLKSFGDRSFEFYGPYVWNSLPRAIRESASLETFKKALKSHLFSNAFGF